MSERWVQTVITGWGTALAGEGGCSLQGLMTSPGAAAVEAAGETAKQTEQNWIYAIWKKNQHQHHQSRNIQWQNIKEIQLAPFKAMR